MRLPQTPSKRLQDVFNTCLQDVFYKSSWRGLQDIFMKTSCGYVLKDKKMLYWGRLQYLFTKTNVWWVSLSCLSVVVCSVILHHKHSRSSSNLCWSLSKATSCGYNNSKYGQGKSGSTSQRTVCRQYVASGPPNMHCPPANAENRCTRNLTPRCGPLGRALSSAKLTNQRNMSAHPVVDVVYRPKTSTWLGQPSKQPGIFLNTLAETFVNPVAKQSS